MAHQSCPRFGWEDWVFILPLESVIGWGLPQEGHDPGQGSSAAAVIPNGPKAEGCRLIALPAAESTSPSLKWTLGGASL